MAKKSIPFDVVLGAAFVLVEASEGVASSVLLAAAEAETVVSNVLDEESVLLKPLELTEVSVSLDEAVTK